MTQVYTKRPTVDAMEEQMWVQHECLDHGFVRLIDYMGDDAAIVQAARVSYGSGTKTLREDRGLIRYLMSHQHSTPFEMCEIKLHVKLPIFVARQWVRHRTANINEYSARYSILQKEFYCPQLDDILRQSDSNKQGGVETDPLGNHTKFSVQKLMATDAKAAFASYDYFLASDVSRELARIGLPLSTYTEWYWKTDLHNLFHFLTLRADAHAQKEIRDYAEVIARLVERWTPLAYEAWMDYRKNAVTLSAQAAAFVRKCLESAPQDPADAFPHGMSSREFADMKRDLFGED